MCLAIPMRVIETRGTENDPFDPLIALVDADGVTREIRLDLADRIPDPDEYVIIHAGFAIRTLTTEEAEHNLALMREMAEAVAEHDKEQGNHHEQ
ncbi:MAG: HypC/HybG/HupF family hydrogenase formation chaperone [Deltaproteobacteria bacterium]|nr:MAG: HypC/HybG/HupF family hydrogenase formation chaperone [Deltaproteobacteria bacterium]